MDIDIKRIAKLAKLEIEDEKIETFKKEMQDIIKMVEKLPDLSGKLTVDPQNPMDLRKDEIKASLKRTEVLSNAPKVQAGCIVVPKTVE